MLRRAKAGRKDHAQTLKPTQQEHRLLAKQIPEPPGRIEAQRRAPGVERHRPLYPRAGDLAQFAEVLDGAEVDVGRVVPLVGLKRVTICFFGESLACFRRLRELIYSWTLFHHDV